MKKYDFIMGLGRACACSQSLRLAGLQLLSQPWDWITYELQPQGPDLLLRVGVIGSGFKGWFEEEDIEFVKKNPASGKDLYKNRRNQIIYAHDFPPDVPMHESYPAIRAKYDRRVKRFQRLLAEAKSNILAVYMDAPTYAAADVETCREAQRRLQELYPHVTVDLTADDHSRNASSKTSATASRASLSTSGTAGPASPTTPSSCPHARP